MPFSSATAVAEPRAVDRCLLATKGLLLTPDRRLVTFKTLDISCAGASIWHDDSLPPLHPLRMRLWLPLEPEGSTVLEADAHIAQTVLANGRWRSGLNFLRLRPEQIALIAELVAHRKTTVPR